MQPDRLKSQWVPLFFLFCISPIFGPPLSILLCLWIFQSEIGALRKWRQVHFIHNNKKKNHIIIILLLLYYVYGLMHCEDSQSDGMTSQWTFQGTFTSARWVTQTKKQHHCWKHGAKYPVWEATRCTLFIYTLLLRSAVKRTKNNVCKILSITVWIFYLCYAIGTSHLLGTADQLRPSGGREVSDAKSKAAAFTPFKWVLRCSTV